MLRDRKKPHSVVLLPDWSRNNPYQRLLTGALSARGMRVSLGGIPEGCFALNRVVCIGSDIDVVHLHWVNDLIRPIYWSPSPSRQMLKRLLFMLDVWLLRLRGVAVVWTVHNLLAHESQDAEAEIKVRRSLARTCSLIILHSQGALRRIEKTYRLRSLENCNVIPHGNYDGCYPANPRRAAALRECCRIDAGTVVILCFGAIRPYKGIGKLLEVLQCVDRSDLRVIVAGKPIDGALAEEMRRRAAADPRISLFLEHVPTEDVSSFFEVADIVATPFENTLTSGSVILALTMGRPLLLPAEAEVLDAVNDGCALLYETPEALEHILRSLDRQVLARMRIEAARLASERRWDEVARRTEVAYQRCCR